MSRPFRVIHCFRTPVGGLFRHVCDLAKFQARLGYEVGLICDSKTGGARAADALDELEHDCALGVHRLGMQRQISPSDLWALKNVRDICSRYAPDIIHCHGAKGGVYGRIAAHLCGAKAFYTPHGGSLHYDPSSLNGRLYFVVERWLERITAGLIFESQFGAETYSQKVGQPRCKNRVIHNGLRPDEFDPVVPLGDAADFLYIGDLRKLKGVDLFLQGLASLRKTHNVTANIVGAGEDRDEFIALSEQLGLSESVTFLPPRPAREAFALGNTLVVPSRHESLPYIVLEAAGAQMPMIATDVGGISEIFGAHSKSLIPAGDATALHAAMTHSLENAGCLETQTSDLSVRVADLFSIERMAHAVTDFYGVSNPAASLVATTASLDQSATAK